MRCGRCGVLLPSAAMLVLPASTASQPPRFAVCWAQQPIYCALQGQQVHMRAAVVSWALPGSCQAGPEHLHRVMLVVHLGFQTIAKSKRHSSRRNQVFPWCPCAWHVRMAPPDSLSRGRRRCSPCLVVPTGQLAPGNLHGWINSGQCPLSVLVAKGLCSESEGLLDCALQAARGVPHQKGGSIVTSKPPCLHAAVLIRLTSLAVCRRLRNQLISMGRLHTRLSRDSLAQQRTAPRL